MVEIDDNYYDKAYTIAEFSELTEVPQTTLRHWEEKLENAFIVPRDPQKNRFYTDKHLKIVQTVQHLRDSKDFSLPIIKEMLLMLQSREQGLYDDTLDSSTTAMVSSYSDNPTSQVSLQLQQVNQMVVSMEERMNQFFGTLGQVLNDHADQQRDFIRQEIGTLREELNVSDHELIQKVDEKLQERLEKDEGVLREGLQTLKEDMSNEQRALQEKLESGLTEKMEQQIAGSRSEMETIIANQLNKQMEDWAVFSKEELNTLKKPKKKFLGLFGGN